MLKSALRDDDLAHVCSILYAIAQKHVPLGAVTDINELAQISKILDDGNISHNISPKISAHVSDHSSSVVKQSAEYRLMRARFAAALGTIADMGMKKVKKNKNEFHAGVTEGLRRASKIAIMFLEDLDADICTDQIKLEENDQDTVTSKKSRCGFVR